MRAILPAAVGAKKKAAPSGGLEEQEIACVRAELIQFPQGFTTTVPLIIEPCTVQWY
jgi:hypothetical protein